MTQTIARIKQKGKQFEILVDMQKALDVKKGNIKDFLESDRVYTNSKKGQVVSPKDLVKYFGTEDVNLIAIKIVRNGEIQLTQEYRQKQRDMELRRLAEEVSRLTIDPQTEYSHPPDRILRAMKEAKVNSTDVNDIVEKINRILPLKWIQ